MSRGQVAEEALRSHDSTQLLMCCSHRFEDLPWLVVRHNERVVRVCPCQARLCERDLEHVHLGDGDDFVVPAGALGPERESGNLISGSARYRWPGQKKRRTGPSIPPSPRHVLRDGMLPPPPPPPLLPAKERS